MLDLGGVGRRVPRLQRPVAAIQRLGRLDEGMISH